MKTIGIIGGLGPEATIGYYSGIIDAFKTEKGDLNYPEIIIYSVNMSELVGLMKEKKYDRVTALLTEKIEGLKKAGADFAAISANTPHLVFNDLKSRSPIPLISIVEATRDECLRIGSQRTGLFGTGFTMNSTFYHDVFSPGGIEVVAPDPDDRRVIDEKVFSEIELGIFRDDTRNLLISLIEKMAGEQHIDSLILGCTEFPLILTEPYYAGIPMLNTTKIHIDAIVKYCTES